MRTYLEIMSDLNNAYALTNTLKSELENFRKACSHLSKVKRVSMSCGYINRYENCVLCGQFFNLPPEPGDNDEFDNED